MKSACVLMAWCLVVCALAAEPAPSLPARAATAVPLAGGIVLDGRLDDAGWAAAPLHTDFTPLGNDRTPIPAALQTAFRVVYDADTLYIGIRCHEPDMAHLHPYATPGAWNVPLFANDDVEVFLDPVGDRAQCYQFAVDATGAQFMAYLPAADLPPYQPDWYVGAYRGPDYWSVELAIPFAALYMRPAARWSERWVLSVARTRDAGHRGSTYVYSSYTPLQQGYHDFARFGTLGPLAVDRTRCPLMPALPRLRVASAPGGRTLHAALEVTNRGSAPFTGTARLLGGTPVPVTMPPGATVTLALARPVLAAETGTLAARVRLDDAGGHPALCARYDQPASAILPCPGPAPVRRLITKWYLAGTAAGHHGDVYANCDGGHSLFDTAQFPQLRAIQGGRGAATAVAPSITFGNSSTAERKERLISHPYLACTSAERMQLLYRQYRANNLYVYPACRDYEPGHSGGGGGLGDVFPTNMPYGLSSFGYSGSDQPFLLATAYVLAAVSPTLKQALARQGMLMPTLQALLRRHRRGITAANYFTAAAHPPVFRGESLDPEALVRAAHALTPETVPPLALLSVLEEDAATPGSDYPDVARAETLHDTPCVIARVHRRLARELRLVVSARDSIDLLCRPLKFRWVVLRGQARLAPRDGGRACEITVPWQGRLTAGPGQGLDGNRVEIGVFASNGRAWSAPSFVTVFYPDNERRDYDAAGRLLGIDYAAEELAIGYDTALLLPGAGIPGYDISEWPALLARFLDARETPARALRATLSQADLAVLRRAAAALPAAIAAHAQRLAAWKETPPPGTLQEAINQSSRDAGAPLLAVDRATKRSARAIVEGRLNAVLDDPNFLPAHPECAEVEGAAGPRLQAACARLVRLGVLRATAAGGWALAESPPSPGARRELRRLNFLLLTEVLCPGTVRVAPAANYTDPRLVTPLPWADTYHYTAQGTLAGWTRRYADATKDFTAEGREVLTRDALGRPLTAREVRCGQMLRYTRGTSLIARVQRDGRGLTVWDEREQRIIDAGAAGAGLELADLRVSTFPPETDPDGTPLPPRACIDILRRDAEGAVIGMLRYAGGRSTLYLKRGEPFLTYDAENRSTPADATAAVAPPAQDALVELPTGVTYRYRYAGPEDRVGQAVTETADGP